MTKQQEPVKEVRGKSRLSNVILCCKIVLDPIPHLSVFCRQDCAYTPDPCDRSGRTFTSSVAKIATFRHYGIVFNQAMRGIRSILGVSVPERPEQSAAPSDGEIAVSGLRFSYNGDGEVLKNINFRFPKESKTALFCLQFRQERWTGIPFTEFGWKGFHSQSTEIPFTGVKEQRFHSQEVIKCTVSEQKS